MAGGNGTTWLKTRRRLSLQLHHRSFGIHKAPALKFKPPILQSLVRYNVKAPGIIVIYKYKPSGIILGLQNTLPRFKSSCRSHFVYPLTLHGRDRQVVYPHSYSGGSIWLQVFRVGAPGQSSQASPSLCSPA